jgi:hypothetical protein
MNLRKRSLSALIGFAVILSVACGDSSSPDNSNDSGGGSGSEYDSPEEILSDSYVQAAIQQIRGVGLFITPETSASPPNVNGFYNMSGIRYFPDPVSLDPGTWRWSNQTPSNRIDTDYDQGLQTGSNVEGEFIRGSGNEFTVYSVLNISEGGDTERGIIIVDGYRNSQGNVNAVYTATPVISNSAFVPSGGTLNLTLIGGTSTSTEKMNGNSLEGLLKKKE